MKRGRARLLAAACALLCVLVVSACGSSKSGSASNGLAGAGSSTSSSATGSSTSSGSAAASGSVIKVGAVSDITGEATFPQPTAAAKAYFDKLNAAGGIDGHKIDYTVLDSAGSATTAAQDARQLVDQDHVVALVGSTSVYDCPANAALYAKSDVVSIGLGVLPQCFESSNIAEVNDGLFEGTGASLVYAVQTLHKTKPCMVYGNTPPEPALMAKVVAAFEHKTGVKVKLQEEYPGPGLTNWQSYILRASNAGCDAIVPAVDGPPLVAFEKQFTQLGMRSKMVDIELSSAYSTAIGQALGSGADGLYADSEFLPFTGSGASNPALADYLSLMKSSGQVPSAFGEGGYSAAQIFVDVVKGIKGSITPASVTTAFKTMKPVTVPLMGNAWVFSHQGNYSSRFVRLEGGVWEPVAGSRWTTLPLN